MRKQDKDVVSPHSVHGLATAIILDLEAGEQGSGNLSKTAVCKFGRVEAVHACVQEPICSTDRATHLVNTLIQSGEEP
ncbi:hypothetical protein RRG08_020448 [Elysia crispata]|uniref:Uncharacterized protein n=1 Tax=Elysia crispata TaxID=231223 RepID=A0AAE1B558_9GAST|nr:hypothetical protein RRG08_020448 [Elysia crispata]